MRQARFENGKYRDCKWCGGNGCLYCEHEANEEYKRQFPNGPQPIATIKLEDFDDPNKLKKIRNAIGGDALNKAFGPGGKGVDEITENFGKKNLTIKIFQSPTGYKSV